MEQRSDAAAPPGRLARALTPARVVALAVLASIPVKMLSTRLGDPDLWWHLQTGELIADSGIPRTDPFSYTAPGREWVVQEWGAEVFLHWLREWFGLYGILAYRALALLVVYLLVARLLVRRMGSGMGTWALLGLAAYGGAVNWTERPNLLSFVLFVVTLTLLDRRGRAIWWFVPVAALWANLHGMVILGVGLVALVAAAEGLKVFARWEGADAAWAKRLGLVAATGLVATLANPAGPGLLVHAFRLIGTVSGIVSEWGSPSFHEIGPMLFLVLLLATIAAMALNPRRPDPTDVALTLAFTVLALQAVRNLAVAAIVIGLVCARYLPGAIAAIPRRPRARAEVAQGSSAMLGALGLTMAVVGLGLVLVLGIPRSGEAADIVERTYPVAAIDALDRPGVRVFSYDTWSGMVIDRAWPNARVFVDLRWDFYGREISLRYIRTIGASTRWREYLDGSCTTHVLVRPRDPLAQVLALVPEWKVERADRVSVTYARTTPADGCAAYPIPVA